MLIISHEYYLKIICPVSVLCVLRGVFPINAISRGLRADNYESNVGNTSLIIFSFLEGAFRGFELSSPLPALFALIGLSFGGDSSRTITPVLRHQADFDII